jgi:hypothetical protein
MPVEHFPYRGNLAGPGDQAAVAVAFQLADAFPDCGEGFELNMPLGHRFGECALRHSLLSMANGTFRHLSGRM